MYWSSSYASRGLIDTRARPALIVPTSSSTASMRFPTSSATTPSPSPWCARRTVAARSERSATSANVRLPVSDRAATRVGYVASASRTSVTRSAMVVRRAADALQHAEDLPDRRVRPHRVEHERDAVASLHRAGAQGRERLVDRGLVARRPHPAEPVDLLLRRVLAQRE